MPSKKSSSSSQKRAQGAGRVANSEPRLQVFRDFNGLNFQHSTLYTPAEDASVDTKRDGPGDQTDLQMNFVFLQNNVEVASNKTLESRQDLQEMFFAPEGLSFTGAAHLIGNKLYIAKSDGNVGMADLDERADAFVPLEVSTNVPLVNNTESDHDWSSFEFCDNKLIAMSEQGEIWTSDMHAYTAIELSNARTVPSPMFDMFSLLSNKGDLQVVQFGGDDAYPFRVTIAMTYVNRFGPTEISPNTVFYANHPPAEWHAGRYLNIAGTVPPGYDIKAVELYYTTDNAMSMIFLGRAEVMPSNDEEIGGTWSYDWYGYVDATSMWTVANLIAPTENYTKGVHASKACIVDGRMYFWGDSNEPQRLYIGGNPGNLLSISPGTGGGFVDIEPGTGQEIRHVCKYKTQSGNSIVTMLCDSQNSRKEQRFNLVENSISLSNEQSMKSWQAEQVAGALGCKSYDGAVVCADGLYSVSRYGLALTTMTMEYNSQIRANYVSEAIKPVFTDAADMDSRLSNAILIEVDGILYMALGTSSDQQGNLDSVIFCYDIDRKAWWTYTLTVDSPILNMFHVDWQDAREGIGIVTQNSIYLLPTTVSDDLDDMPSHRFLIQSAQISTQMPQQGWQYLSQMEFHFDYFYGDAEIEVRMDDMFGRRITVRKSLSERSLLHDFTVRMRIDQRVMSYTVTIKGKARFRLTHYIARVYTLSNKIGMAHGFDDSVSHRSSGSERPAFKCYNDIRKAIIP